MKRVLLLAVVCAAVVAPAAHATNECRGLKVCVPVAGPWVLTSSGEQVQYDLACPKNYIVAGLDAELSDRGIDIGFVGALGSPVNPGITTKRDAVFLGRLIRGRSVSATFRPHIGCVPASGGGQRVPTAFRAFPPGNAVDRQVREVAASRDRVVTARCPARETLTSASHAIGFAGSVPPTPARVAGIHVTQRIRNGIVALVIRSHVPAVVQVDLLCTPK